MAVRPGHGKDTTSNYRRNAVNAEVSAERQRLRDYLSPVAQEQGLFLEDVEIRIAGAHRTVHVIIDLPEDVPGNISLDRVSEAAKVLSDAMDNDPADDGRPYNLEVSSPGLSRPLTERRHWKRNLGRKVRVDLLKGEDLTGRVTEVGEEGITLIPELPAKKGMTPKQGDPVQLAFGDIRRGKVEVEFTHLDDEPLDDDAGDDNDTTAEEA